MNAASLPIQNRSDQRSLGPDLVRALGAMLVVLLHACVPYLLHPMPGLVWPVRDQASGICDAMFWAIEIFVMPLFLLISGVYSYRALKTCDAWSFLRSRARRLLRPLLFGILVILPIDLYVWMLGLVADGVMPMAKLRSLKVPAPYGDELWGLSHLWYLLYVFLYAAVMVVAAQLIGDRVPLRLRPMIRQASAVAVVLTGVVTLVYAPEVVFGFQHSFLPVFTKWTYSGTFFAGGVAIAIFDPRFRWIDRLAGRNFALGVVATTASVILGCWSLRLEPKGLQTAADSWWVAVSLASLTVAAAWCVALGTIGLANRWAAALAQRPRIGQSIQYLAGASFWIYLVHHPIVGLVQIDSKWLLPSASPLFKSALATAVAVAWALASYQWLIRSGVMGHMIGLTPLRRTAPDHVAPSDQPAQSRPKVRIAA